MKANNSFVISIFVGLNFLGFGHALASPAGPISGGGGGIFQFQSSAIQSILTNPEFADHFSLREVVEKMELIGSDGSVAHYKFSTRGHSRIDEKGVTRSDETCQIMVDTEWKNETNFDVKIMSVKCQRKN